MDFRVIHPIPLTMADVVGQLHVLDALGQGQGRGADGPSGLAAAGTDSESGGNLEASLKRDGAPDICAVPLAARILDVATDRFQFGRKGLDVRLAEMGVFGYVCDGHRRLTHSQARRPGDLLARRQATRGNWRSTAASWVTSDRGGCLRPARCERWHGSAVGRAELGGQPAEQDVEAAVEFGETVVGGPGWREVTQVGEFADRQPVQAEPHHVVGFLGPFDNLLQLGENMAVEHHRVATHRLTEAAHGQSVDAVTIDDRQRTRQYRGTGERTAFVVFLVGVGRVGGLPGIGWSGRRLGHRLAPALRLTTVYYMRVDLQC